MKCSKCKKEILDGQNFCTVCGTNRNEKNYKGLAVGLAIAFIIIFTFSIFIFSAVILTTGANFINDYFSSNPSYNYEAPDEDDGEYYEEDEYPEPESAEEFYRAEENNDIPYNYAEDVKLIEENEIWTKVGENLYFNENSVSIQSDGIVSGDFKEYVYGKLIKNNTVVAYKIIENMAFCDIEMQDGVKKMEFPIEKYYDINDNFIGEYNIHTIWAKEYPGGHLGITHPEDETNGDIYFNTLCKYANP